MAEEFSREVTRQAIARAALALDFKEADKAVLDVMAEVVHHYIETIGEATQANAEGSGRCYPGIQDAISALENKKSITKTNWRELNLFAFGKSDQSSSTVWSQPFPLPLSEFPCAPPDDSSKSFGRKVTSLEQQPPPFFPSHFPPFPPAHTYKKTVAPSSSSSSKKRSADDSSEEARQRAKRLQMAKSMQESTTALQEIVDKSEEAVVGSSDDVQTPNKNSSEVKDMNEKIDKMSSS